jgi:hypothetical protein
MAMNKFEALAKILAVVTCLALAANGELDKETIQACVQRFAEKMAGLKISPKVATFVDLVTSEVPDYIKPAKSIKSETLNKLTSNRPGDDCDRFSNDVFARMQEYFDANGECETMTINDEMFNIFLQDPVLGEVIPASYICDMFMSPEIYQARLDG